MEIAIIADDLTGAADAGAQLVRTGYRTAVAFRGSPVPPANDLDAVALDTDSRQLPPDLAAERVTSVVRTVRNARIVYKKVDSALRGPIATELAAALEATGRERAVVAPAFPSADRTTRGGVQMLRGRPVHETELARDPRTPVREGHIPLLLSGAGLEPVALLGVEDLADPDAVRRTLERHCWVVADAETDAHLEDLARTVPDPADVLWVGSAGLVGALGRVHPGPGLGGPDTGAEPARRVLAVVGSASEVAREQLRRLAEEPGVEAVAFRLPAGAADGAVERAGAALGEDRSVVLYPEVDEISPVSDLADRIVAGLTGVVGTLADERMFDGLALTGGDTAVGVAQALDATGIRLEGEIEAGVPFGTLIGPRSYPVVTKAGGFGAPDTLVRAVEMLKSGRQ